MKPIEKLPWYAVSVHVAISFVVLMIACIVLVSENGLGKTKNEVLYTFDNIFNP